MKFAYINGQDTTARRKRIVEAYKSGRIQILVSSTILDEGFDAPDTAFLILAGGGKAEHRQIQRIGRGMRVAADKEQLTVVDFLDRGKWIGEHARLRARAYRKERAYTVHELTLAEAEEALV